MDVANVTDKRCSESALIIGDVTACDDFSSFLSKELALPHASGILVCGPPGSGKTTLCVRAAAATGRPMIHLSHDILVAARAGEIEAAVECFFASALQAAPVIVLLDDVDTVAPAETGGPADLRSVAALDGVLDSLELDKEGSSGLVLLATASYPSMIHPSLTRRARFNTVVEIRPPDWSSRRTFLNAALRDIIAASSKSECGIENSHDSSTDLDSASMTERALDELSSLTPGFLPADLTALLSRALWSYRNALGENSSCTVTDLLLLAKRVLPAVQPVLMTSAGSSWRWVPWTENALNILCGLDREVELISGCIRSAFQAVGDLSSPRSRVLNALGPIPGAVVYGPSASGKTALARLAPSFLPRGTVNCFCVESAEIIDCHIGAPERKLRALFALARATAPTILIFENIDVLAPRRQSLSDDSSSSSSATTFHRILSTLLVELDGIVAHKKHIPRSGSSNRQALNGGPSNNTFVIATTHELSSVDSAILRPGRLEMHVKLNFPGLLARKDLLLRSLSRTTGLCGESSPCWIKMDNIEQTCLDDIANKTVGWSAADLRALCEEAVLQCIRDSSVIDSSLERPLHLSLQHSHLQGALNALR